MTGRLDRLASRRTLRRRLSAVLVVLAACFVVFSAIAIWTRATVLSTDRYVAVVAAVSRDERVITVVSDKLAEQTVQALGVQARVADVLPERAAFLAAPLTERIQAAVARAMARVLASDRFQDFWVAANRRLHDRLLAVIRGQSDVATLEDGVLTIDLFPLVVSGIGELQTSGVIPASVPLPDLSNDADLEAARQRLGTALGVDLPSDVGKVVVVDAPALERLQSMVGTLDAVVVWLLVLTVLLAVAAVVVSIRRWVTVARLAILTIGVLVVARILIGAVIDALVSSVANPEAGATLGAVAGRLEDDLVAWLAIILLAAAVVALVAWLVDRVPRREWVRPSPDDLRTLGMLALVGGVLWAILGVEAVLLGAVAVALAALWRSDAEPAPASSQSSAEGSP